MKATEDKLSELHGKLADVLRAQLNEQITLTNEATGEQETVYTASPATLAAAIKFLKDNDITSAIEDDNELGNLQDLVKDKRKRRQDRTKLSAVE